MLTLALPASVISPWLAAVAITKGKLKSSPAHLLNPAKFKYFFLTGSFAKVYKTLKNIANLKDGISY